MVPNRATHNKCSCTGLKPFHATGLFLFPLKTSENLVLGRKRPSPWKRLSSMGECDVSSNGDLAVNKINEHYLKTKLNKCLCKMSD